MNVLRSGGFTLIEVVVALAILASTLYGGFFLLNQTTINSFHLRDKVLANWVATNAYATIVLDNAGTRDREAQVTEQSLMYGEEFLVTLIHEQTSPLDGQPQPNSEVEAGAEVGENAALQKITISVAKASSPASELERIVVYQ